jgi:NADPH:quinone reductase-like Zn-dependent oxidoreductase
VAGERAGEVVVGVEHERGQQRVAALEVAVEGRTGDPELTRDRVDRHRAGTALGQLTVVLGASGGVGTTLVQLARHAGIEVIGTAGPKAQDALRSLGVTPIDYRSENVSERVRALAPNGVAPVFDHVGGPGIKDSWSWLARGGTLVSYGTASTRDVPGHPALPVLKLIAKLQLSNALPNGRKAHFFNLWAGYRFRRDRFRARLREDLTKVFELVRDGAITPQIAARYRLHDAAEALRFAEAGGFTGKVLLLP